MRIPWLYTGPDGRSRFGELDLQQVPRADAVGASTQDVEAGTLRFQTAAPGVMDFHPAPRRQLVVVLSGTLEIELADGQKRTFGPGQLFLADDTAGQGHVTRTVGGARTTLQVGLPDGLDLTRWQVA